MPFFCSFSLTIFSRLPSPDQNKKKAAPTPADVLRNLSKLVKDLKKDHHALSAPLAAAALRRDAGELFAARAAFRKRRSGGESSSSSDVESSEEEEQDPSSSNRPILPFSLDGSALPVAPLASSQLFGMPAPAVTMFSVHQGDAAADEASAAAPSSVLVRRLASLPAAVLPAVRPCPEYKAWGYVQRNEIAMEVGGRKKRMYYTDATGETIPASDSESSSGPDDEEEEASEEEEEKKEKEGGGKAAKNSSSPHHRRHGHPHRHRKEDDSVLFAALEGSVTRDRDEFVVLGIARALFSASLSSAEGASTSAAAAASAGEEGAAAVPAATPLRAVVKTMARRLAEKLHLPPLTVKRMLSRALERLEEEEEEKMKKEEKDGDENAAAAAAAAPPRTPPSLDDFEAASVAADAFDSSFCRRCRAYGCSLHQQRSTVKPFFGLLFQPPRPPAATLAALLPEGVAPVAGGGGSGSGGENGAAAAAAAAAAALLASAADASAPASAAAAPPCGPRCWRVLGVQDEATAAATAAVTEKKEEEEEEAAAGTTTTKAAAAARARAAALATPLRQRTSSSLPLSMEGVVRAAAAAASRTPVPRPELLVSGRGGPLRARVRGAGPGPLLAVGAAGRHEGLFCRGGVAEGEGEGEV